MEKTIESSRLLRASTSASTPSRVATATLLRGIVLTTRGVLSWLMLVCDVMHALARLGPTTEA
jgi:hypothetical protein